MVDTNQYKKIFSIPVDKPEIVLKPGDYYDQTFPNMKKIKFLITDIYIENQGGGTSIFHIIEQKSQDEFVVRYTFRTATRNMSFFNFLTGLKLGDNSNITAIRIENSKDSQANIIARINGTIIGASK